MAWWASSEVASVMAALRLVRSTADDGAAAVLLGGWGGLSEAAVALLSRRAHEQQVSPNPNPIPNPSPSPDP